MVAQLDEESMRIVVNGREGRSGGLVNCSIGPVKETYDHKRQHKLADAKKDVSKIRLPILYFQLMRYDGTKVRLHPERSTTKFDGHEMTDAPGPKDPPPQGLGKSSGPGCYKSFKLHERKLPLRVDASRIRR